MKTFLNELMLFDVNAINKLNSLTKYPSILTYHNLGPRGSLVDSLVEDQSFGDNTVYITEKIDGTNSRIIFSTDATGSVEDYIIGSREDFLYAMGDRIVNPALGIVKNMKNIADTVKLLGEDKLRPNCLYCLYGETYGGKINNARQYSTRGNYGVRIFDLFIIEHEKVEELMDMCIDHISTWREQGNQPFVSVDYLKEFCDEYCLDRVPYITITNGLEIPLTLQEVWDWMQRFERSDATIDDSGCGGAEGVVVRFGDRSFIRKIRFEDYARTKKMGLIK